MFKKIINWFKSFHLVEKRFKCVGVNTFELSYVYGDGSIKTYRYEHDFPESVCWYTIPNQYDCHPGLSLELSRLERCLNHCKREEYIEPQ